MKQILASLVLAFMLFPALALGGTVKFDDLVFRTGLYYKKFTDVPFTGEVTGETQGSVKDGKEEGLWVDNHKNGQISSKGTYTDGKQDGPWVGYDQNGNVRDSYTGTFKDGVKISD